MMTQEQILKNYKMNPTLCSNRILSYEKELVDLRNKFVYAKTRNDTKRMDEITKYADEIKRYIQILSE